LWRVSSSVSVFYDRQTELSNRLHKERPRNALDVRHRLDKDGKRYGKVIDFKVSELRAIELLDNLCGDMDKYHLEGEAWVASSPSIAADENSAAAKLPSKDELKEQRKMLKNVCSDIVGRWEEDLTRAIKDGKANPLTVRQVLCVDMADHCHSDEYARGASFDEL